jgi:hypothetical protein
MSSASSPTLTDRSTSDAESWAVLLFATAASAVAVVWSWNHGAMLNYGDAVAHLHIARRVLDSRTPGFTQLGSVWLPLPHILLIPFVQNYQWWATGLAGVIPSALAYLASCAGIYRLARHWLSPAAAALALVFFALNPNLLYLQTTAMTEPLFLCEFIWIVALLVEWRIALSQETQPAGFNLRPVFPAPSARPASPSRTAIPSQPPLRIPLRPLRASQAPGPRRGAWLGNPLAPPASPARIFFARSDRLQACIAAVLVAAIFTRYDGWIIAFLAWTGIGLTLLTRAAKGERGRLSSLAFWLSSLAVVAAPVLWFIYNSVAFGDWLSFARGPFSARAIELRTAAPGGGPPHPGWHDPWVSLLFFLKVSELDSTAAPALASAWGNIVLAFAAVGTAAAFFAKKFSARRRALAWPLLLWLPIPFYTWSVAYGSVPIFLPAWWPHSWYNTRYGLELLPALALGLGFAAQILIDAFGRLASSRLAQRLPRLMHLQPLVPAVAFASFFALAGLNLFALLREDPLVYIESTRNLDARLPYDDAIPPLLHRLLAIFPRAPVLMNTSSYPEIVSFTGIPLRQTINEGDHQVLPAALAAPAKYAAVIVAFDGDAVDHAVKVHPANLDVAGHFTAPGQPSATVYLSSLWVERSPLWKMQHPAITPGNPIGTESNPVESNPN